MCHSVPAAWMSAGQPPLSQTGDRGHTAAPRGAPRRLCHPRHCRRDRPPQAWRCPSSVASTL
ncbi:hypothetical protein DWC19_02655 [Streptomyces sp. M7]|nr:hypothetical protein DWC19_02655 [Streptomyces sp. M7]